MKQWGRTKIMKGLQKIVPEINYLEKSEDVCSKKGGIWTSGEDAGIYKGLLSFDCHVEYGELPLSDTGYADPKYKDMKVKTMYVNGIHREIYNWIEKRGWYPEWYNAGTLFFLKDMYQTAVDIVDEIIVDSSGKIKGLVL